MKQKTREKFGNGTKRKKIKGQETKRKKFKNETKQKKTLTFFKTLVFLKRKK
jgi:hypothetical protein